MKYIIIIILSLSICIGLYLLSYENIDHKPIYAAFTISDNSELPIRFTVNNNAMSIEKGIISENMYHFQNLSLDTIYFRPIHQLFPDELGEHYSMLKCFCFDDMILFPKENLELPMSFLISKDLSKEIDSVRIHYSLIKRNKADVLIEE